MAGALALLGTDHALLVSSEDGLDELSISAPTHVVEVTGDELSRSTVTPEEVGLARAPADAIPGGDPPENAATTRRILAGEPGRRPRTWPCSTPAPRSTPGVSRRRSRTGSGAAEEAIDTGAAAEALERFVARTRELAPVR